MRRETCSSLSPASYSHPGLYRNALYAPAKISAMPAWLKARRGDHPGDKARKLAGNGRTTIVAVRGRREAASVVKQRFRCATRNRGDLRSTQPMLQGPV